jgi:hypothetical protein
LPLEVVTALRENLLTCGKFGHKSLKGEYHPAGYATLAGRCAAASA